MANGLRSDKQYDGAHYDPPQAAVAAQSNGTTQETHHSAGPLKNIDLVSPDPADDDDSPPPAYGQEHGEFRNEKDGLVTAASMADDGRVNLRINQINRRMSQIFSPALRQQFHEAQAVVEPPTPYIPPALGGRSNLSLPPSLSIVMHVVGSRGDVQPFVALGQVLRDRYKHRVRLATHPHFRAFVEESGLEFFSIGGDSSGLMAFMAKNSSLMPGFQSIMSGDIAKRRRDVGEYIQGCWRSCYEAGDGMSGGASEAGSDAKPFVADCIIANPPSFAHIHCAEKLGIPLHIMFTMPDSPTQAFPHPLVNIQSSNIGPQLTNFFSYAMIELMSWQFLGDIINRFRKKCLALDRISSLWGPGMLQRCKVPHTYCWSSALIPKPKDWGPHISVSGFALLKSPDYQPAADLRAFLDSGPAPVYIGFGSIVLKNPDELTHLILDAVRRTGRRVLLSTGWQGIGMVDHKPGVFLLGNVPHDWLFEHVSCVVHHGDAGTTAAGIRAGRPTVVIPFFGDQHFWGSMISRAGAGPDPIPYKALTAEKLADAIKFCSRPATIQNAQNLASKIAMEQGADTAAQFFHKHLHPDRLRCSVMPSLAAVWSVKRTKIQLSAFAACTLANAHLLDFRQLKLLRVQEYVTDQGPVDPISGSFTAVLRTFSSMTMGLTDIPVETYKALKLPAEYSRQRSSGPTSKLSASTRSQTLAMAGEELSYSVSPSESRASLRSTMSKPSRLRRNPSTVSGRSGLTSDTLPSALQSTSSTPPTTLDDDDASSMRKSIPDSRPSSSTNRQKDLLRQTGPHTSKGLGRMVRALVQSPGDISVALTKGLHNMPKLWGDETVRPQEQVRDLKSGMRAVGREFGYGWYDGVTGLVTHPWQGARSEGASGFMKGVGKGMGAFIVKPSAATLGVVGHSMRGVHKEVQKWVASGSGMRSFIAAERMRQGYEAWLGSGDEERNEVVKRWRELQGKGKGKAREDRDEVVDFEGIHSGPGKTTSTHHPTADKEYQDTPHAAAGLQHHHYHNDTTSRRRRSSDTDDMHSSTSTATLDDDVPVMKTDHAGQPSSGSTRYEFPSDEKTSQEKREEQIVLEYVKKQSLLEAEMGGRCA